FRAVCRAPATFPDRPVVSTPSRRPLSARARRHPQHRLETAFDVVVRRRPAAHADAHGGAPVPYGASAPAGALLLQRGDHAPRALGVAERDEHLLEHDVVQDLEPGGGASLRETARLAAVALDQPGAARAPERAQRRPDFNAARTAR